MQGIGKSRKNTLQHNKKFPRCAHSPYNRALMLLLYQIHSVKKLILISMHFKLREVNSPD